MISYEPFFNTLRDRNLSQYHMVYKQGFSSNIIHRIKEGKPISMKSLDELCFALDCKVTDIIQYVKDGKEKATDKKQEKETAG